MAAASPVLPRDLTEHALAIARHAVAHDLPKTWLRRSTSASYYAVFHAVALAVVEQVAPRSPGEVRHRLTRSVEHHKVRDVCGWVRGRGDGREHVAPIVRRLRANSGLVEFAELFTSLQAARHAADYDHHAPVELELTIEHHRAAVRALDLLDAVRRTPDGGEFLALIALHTNLR